MKKIVCTLTLILVFLISNADNLPEGFKEQKNGIAFTENKGQMHDQNYKPRPDVLFGAMAGNMAFHLKTTGVSYQLYRVDKYKEVEDVKTKEKRKEIDQQTIYRIDLNWLNANKNFAKTTDQTLEGFNNYYTEGCPEGGAINVKSYSGVTLHNLYDGINLHYYEKDGQLKHDYIVAPNTDYKQIQIKVEGASVSINKDGSLLLTTLLGKIQEGAPIVYQNGKQLKAKWVIKTCGELGRTTDGEQSRTISFEIENYNANLELIIDPVTRLWGTYYGGTGIDNGRTCATDAVGNVYMSGRTTSSASAVISTVGPHQTTYGGGTQDAFLVKFNSNGVRQWGTYYGGTGTEYGYSCAIDTTGNIYMTGITNSNTSTVIATTGAHQTTSGGSIDAFLVKFDQSGARQWGTYYGGSGDDNGWSCATDIEGNVYLTGYSSSNSSIASPGAHQAISGGGDDAFLVKFNLSGVRQWATYYGGVGNDYGYNCSTDATGNVYLTGRTASNASIATSGAHQAISGGSDDAFLSKFNSSGVRLWGTYYGGTGSDVANSCATDTMGNIYFAGYAASNTGTAISTLGAHQTVNGGGIDAFLAKFNSNGVRQWGSYYGGIGSDFGQSCTTDAAGNVYLGGQTNTTAGTAISTPGSHQTVNGGTNYDGYLVKFNSSGVRQWGTYYGGASNEYGYSCATDNIGNVYFAGYTGSNVGTVIATSGAHQTVYSGSDDAFLVKFNECVSMSPIATTSATLCAGSTINLSVSITGTVTPTYLWSGPNSYNASVQNPSIANAGTVHIGTYTVTITNGLCIEKVTTVINFISPCTGLSQVVNTESELIIFPNPFNNKVIIISNGAKQSVQIYNALSALVCSTTIENEKTEIDLTQEPSGVYFIRIGNTTKKIIKE